MNSLAELSIETDFRFKGTNRLKVKDEKIPCMHTETKTAGMIILI